MTKIKKSGHRSIVARPERPEIATIPKALEALADMEQELVAARTYAEIRKIARAAEMLKHLLRDVAEVKQKAEWVVLAANIRIGEEIKKVPKTSGGDQRSKLPRRVNSKSGRAALGVSGTTRARLQKLAIIGLPRAKATAEKLWADGKDATTKAVLEENIEITRKTAQHTAETEANEITLEQWHAMSEDERRKCLDPKNFPSDVLFNAQDTEGIDWARNSWNIVPGCKHACWRYCYAYDITKRFPNAFPHGFAPVFRPRMLNAPYNTKVPKEAGTDARYKNVFVNSMGDLFGRWVPREIIEAILNVVRENPQWTFLFLTKFPKRMAEFDFPPNCWLGATVDLQVRVRSTEAAFAKLRDKGFSGIIWTSVEPMLEPIRFQRIDLFNWIVIGGASQSMRTPEFQPPFEWVMDLVARARPANVKIFMKTNLLGNRILELPTDAPIQTDPMKAPDIFNYLKKSAASDDGDGIE